MGDCFAPLGHPLLPWDLIAQTDRQTDGHGDSMTNSAQLGRVGENQINLYIYFLLNFFSKSVKCTLSVKHRGEGKSRLKYQRYLKHILNLLCRRNFASSKQVALGAIFANTTTPYHTILPYLLILQQQSRADCLIRPSDAAVGASKKL